MSDEWSFGGGRYKSVVYLEELRGAQPVAQELAHRIRAIAQVLEMERDGLRWPTGDNRGLAYGAGVPRSADDMETLAVQARRLDADLLWLREGLVAAEHTYLEAEQRLQAEIDKRKDGSAGFWKVVLRVTLIAFTPMKVVVAVHLIEIAYNYLENVFERIADGDFEEAGVGSVLLAAAADDADGTIAALGGLVQLALQPILGRQDAPGTVGAARLIRDGLVHFLGASEYDVIVERLRGEVPYASAAHTLPPPSSDDLSDVVRGLDALSSEAAALPGVIEIRENRLPNGTRTWTVLIPGTQELSLGSGANPKDMRTNLDLLADGTADTTLGVYHAMKDAGIPSNEPVMLVGHSQGGMTAASLASIDGIEQDFRIDSMLTVGSPIGAGFDIPESVNVMSLEHSNDVIAALDGAKNEHTDNHVTVVYDFRESDDLERRALAHDIGAAHSLDAYSDTVDLLLDQGFEPVDAWLSGAAAMVGPRVTVTEASRYQIRRAPEQLVPEGVTRLTNPPTA